MTLSYDKRMANRAAAREVERQVYAMKRRRVTLRDGSNVRIVGWFSGR